MSSTDNNNSTTSPELVWLNRLSDLMDNQFKVPGTSFRFGLDGILGLIPGVGDVAGLGVSFLLFIIMFRKGAGPLIILQMLGNIILDALVGVVPFVGDLFDFGFKANRRNVNLLREYYGTNTPKPRTIWSLAIILLVIMIVFGLVILLIWKIISWLWAWGATQF